MYHVTEEQISQIKRQLHSIKGLWVGEIDGAHIDTCEDCREELEIYFTVDVGIRQLDEGTGTYNIKGALETALEISRQRIHTLYLLQTARYAVNTLCFWAVVVVLILQLRIWGQLGFLGL